MFEFAQQLFLSLMSMAFCVFSNLCLPQGHKVAFSSLLPWILHFYEVYVGSFCITSTSLNVVPRRRVGSWYFYCLWALMECGLPEWWTNYEDCWKSHEALLIGDGSRRGKGASNMLLEFILGDDAVWLIPAHIRLSPSTGSLCCGNLTYVKCLCWHFSS